MRRCVGGGGGEVRGKHRLMKTEHASVVRKPLTIHYTKLHIKLWHLS